MATAVHQKHRKLGIPIDSRMVVCVDEVTSGQPAGTFYHFNSHQPYPFTDWGDMILQMDWLLDRLDHPQSSLERRAWNQKTPSAAVLAPPVLEDRPIEFSRLGEKATFTIFVITRQNGTWQGEVTWVSHGGKAFFHSALELMWLLDSGCTGKDC